MVQEASRGIARHEPGWGVFPSRTGMTVMIPERPRRAGALRHAAAGGTCYAFRPVTTPSRSRR